MLEQILHFILPQVLPPEWLQIGFFTVIFVAVIHAWRGVRRHATPDNWARNWHREVDGKAGHETGNEAGSDAGQLDVEHGSVNDLSAAVATPQEKLADILPGMLLIVGLLGTFVGLGLALDKASVILSQATGSGGMDSMMDNLMSMMHGLGSKFKTSTWGILAFLTLKIYCSRNGFEERRLNWCIGKMKTEVDRRRKEARELQVADNRQLVDAIGALGAVLRDNAAQQAQDGAQRHAQQLEALAALRAGLKAQTAQGTQQLAKMDELVVHNESTRHAIETFVDGVSANITAMAEASANMASAAVMAGRSTAELQAAISEFRVSVAEVLDDMKSDLGQTIADMSGRFAENMAVISEKMSDATGDISRSITTLSTSVDTTLKSVEAAVGQSLSTQQKAHGIFVESSDTLNVNVQAMTNLVEDLREKIVSGLKSVSESVRRTAELGGHYERIADVSQNVTGTLEAAAATIRQAATANKDDRTRRDMLAALHSIDNRLDTAVIQMTKPPASERRARGGRADT
ncbi:MULTISPECIES: hypothetical protein [Cupriavidus]